MIAHPYIEQAVSNELATLRGTGEGGRAQATYKAAAALGSLVGAGAMTSEEAESLLLEASLATGLPQAEATSNVRRGLRTGIESPRQLPESVLRNAGEKAISSKPPPATKERPLKRPPVDEVRAVWALARPVTEDAEASRFLRSRALDPVAIEDWDLARAIPLGVGLPRWAWTKKGGSWSASGHRLIFRAWGASGECESLRARQIEGRAGLPKALAPAGASIGGLVLADPLGVQLLQGHVPDWWMRRLVVITEGEPDWLTWASRQREGDPEGPVYFGVESGSWIPAIADRIPNRAEVVIRTHHDAAGDSYAEKIASTLDQRCSVSRSKPGASQ